jgi:hypothetical protein
VRYGYVNDRFSAYGWRGDLPVKITEMSEFQDSQNQWRPLATVLPRGEEIHIVWANAGILRLSQGPHGERTAIVRYKTNAWQFLDDQGHWRPMR